MLLMWFKLTEHEVGDDAVTVDLTTVLAGLDSGIHHVPVCYSGWLMWFKFVANMTKARET